MSFSAFSALLSVVVSQDFLPYGSDSNGTPLYPTIESKSYCDPSSSDDPCTEQFRCPWLNSGSNLYFEAAQWDKQNSDTNGIMYLSQALNMVAYYTLGTTGGNFPINPDDSNQIGSCWHIRGTGGFGLYNQNDIILQNEGLGGSDSNCDICSIQGGCGDYNCCEISLPDVTYKAQCPAGTPDGYAGCGPTQQNEVISNDYGDFTITDPGGCPHVFNGIDLSTQDWKSICSIIYLNDTNNDAGPLFESCMNEGPFMPTGADPVIATRVRCPEGLMRLTGLVRDDNSNYKIAEIGMANDNSSYWEADNGKTVSAGGDCRIDTGNYYTDNIQSNMIFCGPQLNSQPGPIDDLSNAVWGGNEQQVEFANSVAGNSYLNDWVLAYGSVPIFYSDNVNGGDWTNEIDNQRLCY